MNKNIDKVFIAADHRGVGLKLYLIEMLSALGYNMVNLGTDDLDTPVDFPDVAKTLADAMLDTPNARGILVCGTGAGVQIAANRYRSWWRGRRQNSGNKPVLARNTERPGDG